MLDKLVSSIMKNYEMRGEAVDGRMNKKRKAKDGEYEENKLKRVKIGAKSADGKLGS